MKAITNIQVLRGLAACGVLLSHAVGTVLGGDIPRPPVPDLEWAAFGVDVFFVISGFIMPYASVGDFGSARAVLPFLGRRVIRVVPLYWIATLAFVLMILPYLDRTETRRLWQDALRSMFFIPAADGKFALLPPGWSMYFEMLFYVMFAAVLPLRRTSALVIITILMLALTTAGGMNLLPIRVSYFGSSQVLEFVSGLYIAEARLSGWRVPPRIGHALAALALIAVALDWPPFTGWQAWRGVVWGIPATMVVAGLALAPQPAAPASGAVRRILDHLGDASYSIYLTHFPLFWISNGYLFWIAESGPRGAQVYVGLLVVLGLAASLVVHRLVERPMLGFMRGLARSSVRHRRAELLAAEP